ncbi:MAG: DUF2851 family protein [Akkermansiaceae bacterium]|nr:DUF2851 family protein [Akkermansiaceae bacterium]
MTHHGPQHLAASYSRFRAEILCSPAAADAPERPVELPELAVQELWELGALGCEGVTQRHGPVRLLDFGEWNRGAGPDFCRAEIELGGTRIRGDIEIDPDARDWERHGHGANPLYNNVILHVVLSEPPAGWFTRNSLHSEIPVLFLPPRRVRDALDMAPPVDAELVSLCRAPLEQMPAARVESLLQAAAAHRLERKRKRFRCKEQVLGRDQAWFESWAETLGYSANKDAMLALARRAPLDRLGKDAEAILFGTAGFLVPMLPDKASAEARLYHRQVWDSWWLHKQHFALSAPRDIRWSYAGLRPLNHPQRRVAALALSALHWRQLAPLLTAELAPRLEELLTHLRHPFWDYHCTLNSAQRSARAALVGKERVRDFLVNFVYVQDTAPAAWETFLRLKSAQAPARVERTARRLFGQRSDLAPLLRHHYAQQALLQIAADFCTTTACRECLFPTQLQQWAGGGNRLS